MTGIDFDDISVGVLQHSAILGFREDHLRLMLIHLGAVVIVYQAYLEVWPGVQQSRAAPAHSVLVDASGL